MDIVPQGSNNYWTTDGFIALVNHAHNQLFHYDGAARTPFLSEQEENTYGYNGCFLRTVRGKKSGKIKTNMPFPLSFHCYCDKHQLNSVKCLNFSLVKESDKEGTEQIIFQKIGILIAIPSICVQAADCQ